MLVFAEKHVCRAPICCPPSLWPLAWVRPECSPSLWRGTPLRPTHRSTSPLPLESSPQPPTSPHLIITLFFRMREGCYPPISERQADNFGITCYKHYHNAKEICS